MTSQPIIWVLLDNRPGTANQALGVAEALRKPFEPKPLIYSGLANLPNMVLCGLNVFSNSCLALSNPQMLDTPLPDLIISAGRRAAYVALWIKRHRALQAKIVQIMDPGFCHHQFDLLAVPAHDDFTVRHPNVIHTLGNPHRMTAIKLAMAKDQWQAKFANLSSPRIAVLLGGETKGRGLTGHLAIQLLDKANHLASAQNASLLISTSRRTPAIDTNSITAPHYIYRWQDGGDNPYAGILAHADAVIVSGDSTSMLAEACSTGKPVYIFSPPGMVSAKHQRLHRQLIDQAYARPLGDKIDFTQSGKTLSVAEQIASLINNM